MEQQESTEPQETVEQLKSLKIGFIGGGNMASAIGTALINKGILDPNKCWVSTHTNKTHSFWQKLGTHPTLNNGEVLDNCDVVFLAIKPQMLDNVIDDIIKDFRRKGLKGDIFVNSEFDKMKYKNKLLISVLAGVTLRTLHTKLGIIGDSLRIIRSMPNTPLMIGEGITVYCTDNATPQDLEMIHTLFCHMGICEEVPESLMDATGGLSGCGPAFAYLIIEALSDGAVRMGVPRSIATKFAAQVLVGAGKMVLQTGRHPGQLKDEVCSAGGITIAGVHAMEVGGVRASMINAVQAAVNKASDLR